MAIGRMMPVETRDILLLKNQFQTLKLLSVNPRPLQPPRRWPRVAEEVEEVEQAAEIVPILEAHGLVL